MLKKLDPKNMQLIYHHSLYKLVRVSEPGKENLQPIIFICGQMEHHMQKIESKTGLHLDSCYNYRNYFMYDDEVNTPYIFVYDYPINKLSRDIVASEVMVKSLEVALELFNLEDVIVMGISHGGIIGTLLSKSKRVSEVVAMHSPIFGVPLLDRETFDKAKSKLILPEKIAYYASKILVDDSFSYMKLMKDGLPNISDVADLDKITFTGSDLKEWRSKSDLGNFLAQMIYRITGKKTDGIVTYDEELVKREGLNFVKEDGISHFELGNPSYTLPYYEKLVRKRK